MKRNTVLVVVVVLAAIVLLFDPLQFFGRNRAQVSRSTPPPATMTPLVQFARSSWRSPEDYVLHAFADHQVVMLGEIFKVKQNVELVSRLVPRLYAAGVRNLGIEYALSDDQAQIDELLTAPSWDEAKARAITFDWLVTWGYQEYIDIYHAAWLVNNARPKGAPPFRILGLNARQHWEYLKSDRDMADPKITAQIFSDGLPDQRMAEVVTREVVARGEKGLVFCSTQHVFTRYRSTEYARNSAAMKFTETRRAGNILFDSLGPKVFGISLHAPWPGARDGSGLVYAAGGAIDALIDALPAGQKDGGWDTAGTALGALPVKDSSYGAGGAAKTLADIFDGYIVQGPITGYTMVTPIKDFVRDSDAERAAKEFPGVKQTPPTVAQVNQSIADDVAAMAKSLAQFK